jgi:uncharacterized protein (DUF2147 family)
MRLSVWAAVIAVAFLSTTASAAEIEGVWKTESGEQAQFYGCGKAMCIKLLTGDYKGQVISDDLADDGSGQYSGSLRDPSDDKVYSGHAKLSGGALKLQGCALKIFCKTQTWARVK